MSKGWFGEPGRHRAAAKLGHARHKKVEAKHFGGGSHTVHRKGYEEMIAQQAAYEAGRADRAKKEAAREEKARIARQKSKAMQRERRAEKERAAKNKTYPLGKLVSRR